MNRFIAISFGGLTQKVGILVFSLPHVAAAMSEPDFTVIPYSEMAKHTGLTKLDIPKK